MVLSKRFSKDISPMLPAVEEAKDAEEEEVSHSLGGIPSRPPSTPPPHLSRGSPDNKIVPRSAIARSVTEEDEKQETKEDIPPNEETEETVPEKEPEDLDKPKEHPDDWDTDLEIEVVKHSYDPSGKARYLSACQLFGVVPVSYFLRHMGDSKLTMRHHGLGAQATKAFALSLVTNTSIVNLDLSDNWLEGEGAAAIADMLKENCYISELHLCDNKLALKGAQAISLMLMENITLQKVNLSGNDFDDQAASYISEALMNNQKVEAMDLSHNMFGDGSGEILGAAIAENTGMLDINLSWNYFRGKGAVAIAKGLGANIFLRVVDLSYNGFGNDGAAALAEALKVNNVLEEVNISNNRIAIQGAVRFALCLKENKTLRVLKMARNPIQSDGCFAVLKSIQANSESALESLDFSDIFVNQQFDDLYAALKTTMPNLSVKLGGNSDMFKRTTHKEDPMSKLKEHARKNKLQATELFAKMDEEKNSLVTHEDFERNITSSILLPHCPAIVGLLLKTTQLGIQNKYLTIMELLRIIQKRIPLRHSTCLKLQEQLNTGIAMSKEEIQQLIIFLDKEKSGTIDISVFHKALSS